MSVLEKLHGPGKQVAEIGRDDDAGAAVPQLVNKLALGIERAQMHEAGTRPYAAEEGDGVIGRIRKVEGKSLPASEPGPEKRGGGFVGPPPQFLEADPPVAVLDRRVGPVSGNGAVEKAGQGRRDDRRIPTNPRRVGALPGKCRTVGHAWAVPIMTTIFPMALRAARRAIASPARSSGTRSEIVGRIAPRP